jgi:hypothetical protein
MKYIFLFARIPVAVVVVLLLGLAAAHSLAADPATTTNAAPPVKTDQLPIVGVKDFLQGPEIYSGKEIILQGFVTDVCRRKGCWALLHDKDADAKGLIRVKQNEEGDTFKAFLPELQGKTILVTGKVLETKIDNNYLDKWEDNVKVAKKKAAIAGSQKPEDIDSYDTILKRIAGLRASVAKSKLGYLSSYTLAVATWETQPEKP